MNENITGRPIIKDTDTSYQKRRMSGSGFKRIVNKTDPLSLQQKKMGYAGGRRKTYANVTRAQQVSQRSMERGIARTKRRSGFITAGMTFSDFRERLNEATYKGKTVPLNKPMAGDVKKSKVFVDPDGDGKAQKVNFGDKNMSIKKHIPARKKSFRARHNCDNPGPKTKARYWSCKAW